MKKNENETLCVFGMEINPGQTVFNADHKKTIRVSASLKPMLLGDSVRGNVETTTSWNIDCRTQNGGKSIIASKQSLFLEVTK